MGAQNWLRLAMAVSVVVLAAFFGLLCWNTHTVLYREADDRIIAETRELGEDVAALVHASDLIGQLLDRTFESLPWDEITRSETTHRKLTRLEQEIPGSSITLIRPDGRIADDSRVLHDPRNDS